MYLDVGARPGGAADCTTIPQTNDRHDQEWRHWPEDLINGDAVSAAGPVDRGEPADRHRAAMALSALGDARRLDVFSYLVACSPSILSPVGIARDLGLSPRVVGAELSKLRRAHLVRETRVGRRRTFTANVAVARDCLEMVHELARVLRPA